MRRGQSRSFVVHLFIPFSRGKSLMSRRSTPKYHMGDTQSEIIGETTGNITANTQETRSAGTWRSTPKIHTVH
jgi:hypothetical protein